MDKKDKDNTSKEVHILGCYIECIPVGTTHEGKQLLGLHDDILAISNHQHEKVGPIYLHNEHRLIETQNVFTQEALSFIEFRGSNVS